MMLSPRARKPKLLRLSLQARKPSPARLTDASSVTVRGKAATIVTVVNDTTVTAVTPPGSVGAANVQVTTPGGTATISGAFTYGSAPPPPAWCTVLEQSPNATVVPDATLLAAITATNLPWRVRDTGTGITHRTRPHRCSVAARGPSLHPTSGLRLSPDSPPPRTATCGRAAAQSSSGPRPLPLPAACAEA